MVEEKEELELTVVRLDENYEFTHFDCGEEDLNDFLLNDAKDYQRRLLAVTYIIEAGNEIAAYFSLSNDKISLNESSKSVWRKIKRSFPRSKHRRDYPSVKIGRLAVNSSFQRLRIGTVVMNFLKVLFKSKNRTGCVYLTVDALARSARFYEKNGFEYLYDVSSEDTDSTHLMFYDLNHLK